MFLQGKKRRNVLKRQHMDKCSKDGSGRMVWNGTVHVRLFHLTWASISRHASSGAGNFASSCESKWSAHWHIHTKVSNRLADIYSNRKALAAAACDDTLEMLSSAWVRSSSELVLSLPLFCPVVHFTTSLCSCSAGTTSLLSWRNFSTFHLTIHFDFHHSSTSAAV